MIWIRTRWAALAVATSAFTLMFPSVHSMVLLSLVILVSTIRNVRWGISAWLLAFSGTALVGPQVDGLPVLYLPALLVGAAVHAPRMQFRRDLAVRLALPLVTVGVLVLVSTLLNRHLTSINAAIAFVSILVAAALIAHAIAVSSLAWRDFLWALSIGGMFLALLSLSEAHDLSRLGVDGRIRALANVVALPLTAGIIALLLRRDTVSRRENVFLVVTATVLGGTLFLTVSRGALVSVLGAVTAAILFSLSMVVWRRRVIRRWVDRLFGIVGVIVAVAGGTWSVLHGLGTSGDMVTQRFRQEALGAGLQIRMDLWSSVLRAMLAEQPWIGHGLGGFRYLAGLQGSDFYAHSVFVDVTVAGGVIAGVALISLLAYGLFLSFQVGEPIALALLIFACLSYATHGEANSPYFWITIGLAFGLISNPSSDQVRAQPGPNRVKYHDFTEYISQR